MESIASWSSTASGAGIGGGVSVDKESEMRSPWPLQAARSQPRHHKSITRACASNHLSTHLHWSLFLHNKACPLPSKQRAASRPCCGAPYKSRLITFHQPPSCSSNRILIPSSSPLLPSTTSPVLPSQAPRRALPFLSPPPRRRRTNQRMSCPFRTWEGDRRTRRWQQRTRRPKRSPKRVT